MSASDGSNHLSDLGLTFSTTTTISWRKLTDDAVLLIQQRRAVWDARLLCVGSCRAGPPELPGWGHQGGGGVVRWGHQCGGVLRRRGLGGRRVAFCETSVSIGRLRRAVHPGGRHSVLVVAPGYLTHRSIMGICIIIIIMN